MSPSIARINSTTGQIIAGGFAGGTASEIAGGEFKGGFTSGAMSYGFNWKQHEERNNALKGNRKIKEGSVHSTRTRVVDVNESSDWHTMGAVGDVPAALMQGAPHPLVRAGGYALDFSDVLSIQSRVTTTGQNLVTETYSHDTLWDATDTNPKNWTETPGVRLEGMLIDTDTKVLWNNTETEIRTCLAANYGCSPAW